MVLICQKFGQRSFDIFNNIIEIIRIDLYSMYKQNYVIDYHRKHIYI